MADKMKGAPRAGVRADAEAFAHKAITLWLPMLYFLISSLFFLRTYDSAQVKISIMQMGGLGLLTLWLCRLTLAGRRAFNKEDLVALSPFLAYLGWGIFSFLHAPYRMASTDFFLRQTFYMIVALIVIYEFDDAAVQNLFNWLIWTAWVAIGYGMLQFVDAHAGFKPGIGNGIDPFVWRGAFGPRVFSTYGNPNFYGDFLVIIFPILLTQFLKTRRWSLIPLMIMLLINLVATETKGAMLGFALTCVLFAAVALYYFAEHSRPYRAKILGASLFGALALVGVTAKNLETHIVSVNFRLFTWEATWDMIRTHPIIGSGLGAFPPLYPAFRRPAIFHIEGKHNTETDHAEDEYLEEFLDNGILGFGIFLWLVFSTLLVGARSLGQLTTSLALKDGRPPPRAYDLAGLMVSFAGMLGHNFFDVSLRFVSSGVYLGLLSGMIVNVARGRGLFELHSRGGAPAPAPAPAAGAEEPLWKTLSEFLIWPARLAAIGGIVYMAFLVDWKLLSPTVGFGGMFGEFASLLGPGSRIPGGGELLQWWAAWIVFAGSMLGLAYALIRLCLMSENPVVPMIVLAMLQPLYLFWGYFKADIHHNVAIYFSKERNWDAAIGNYLVVNKLNPDFVMAKYFLGNVFNDRFNMTKIYEPKWGDKDNVAMDDYERALYWYNEVRRLSPNYVQMHHQVGNLHLRRAQWAQDPANHRPPEEVQHYLDLAINRFRMYEAIDPVFPPNFYRMAQVYILEKKYDDAIKTYERYIDAAQCAADPKLLSNSLLRNTILSYQPYLLENGQWVHRHAGNWAPKDAAEAYTSLANAHYLAEQAGGKDAANHLVDAEAYYKKALGFDPTFENAKRNLEIVYRKAQAEGRLRKAAPPAKMPAPGEPPFTGYEVAPIKG